MNEMPAYEVLPERVIGLKIRCRDDTCGGCFWWRYKTPGTEHWYCGIFNEPLEKSDVWSNQMGTWVGEMSQEFKRLKRCKEAEIKHE